MKNFADPVHFTNLKKMAQSPAHYAASIGVEDDSLAFRLGRLTHALCLGAQQGVKWAVFEGSRRGKAWDEFKAAHEGYDLFTKSEHALAKNMALAITRDLRAKVLLDGEFELPVEWTHETGRKCATRGLDILNRPSRYIVDIKTAQTTQPGRFTREALRMGYHAQASFYRDAARSIGVEVSDVYLIAVEKKAPHVVTVLRFSARAMTEGDKLIRSWMEQLIACEAADEWPGYVQSIVEIDMPEDEAEEFDFGDDEGSEEAAQ